MEILDSLIYEFSDPRFTKYAGTNGSALIAMCKWGYGRKDCIICNEDFTELYDDEYGVCDKCSCVLAHTGVTYEHTVMQVNIILDATWRKYIMMYYQRSQIGHLCDHPAWANVTKLIMDDFDELFATDL